jgi:hypothetical protein
MQYGPPTDEIKTAVVMSLLGNIGKFFLIILSFGKIRSIDENKDKSDSNKKKWYGLKINNILYFENWIFYTIGFTILLTLLFGFITYIAINAENSSN